MKRIILWLKPSFEDSDGTASYRRISAFIFVCLICFMIIGDKITTDLNLRALYALLVTFLLLVGIVTTQNILSFLNKDKDELPPPDQSIIKEGDSVTIKKEN